MNYPTVAGEFATIAKLCKGYSIARFGDGEVKLMEKHVYTRERTPVPELADELIKLSRSPHPKCLIGIPTMDPAGTKYENWRRHQTRLVSHFNMTRGVRYYSAFITRPDCGAWLETLEYYQCVSRLWKKKPAVVCVSEPYSKLLNHLRHVVPHVVHVECPMYGAYAEIDRIQAEVLASRVPFAVLSCGVTATALAHRLTVAGVQALDLGSIGGFLERWRIRTNRAD